MLYIPCFILHVLNICSEHIGYSLHKRVTCSKRYFTENLESIGIFTVKQKHKCDLYFIIALRAKNKKVYVEFKILSFF